MLQQGKLLTAFFCREKFGKKLEVGGEVIILPGI